jgi:hypothetical protein
LYPGLQKPIDDLDEQVSEQALLRPQARRLMTHPAELVERLFGNGPIANRNGLTQASAFAFFM